MYKRLCKWFCLCILCAQAHIWGNNNPSIVFVHIGSMLPNYLAVAVAQARLFNPECPIYVVLNRQASETQVGRSVYNNGADFVFIESLVEEQSHALFKERSHLDRVFRGGFWLFALERFFYLYEMMKAYDLKDVIHLESDVMLYADLRKFMPIFAKHYVGKMGITLDNNDRAIAGIVYVSDPEPLKHFIEYVAQNASASQFDMYALASFKQAEKQWVEQLPILMPAYAEDRPLRSPHNHRGDPPEAFYNHFDDFQSIFDAAAIGQYIGGTDQSIPSHAAGFINESCVFIPSYCQFEWRNDEEGRKIPYAIYRDRAYRINNLHIHSKQLRLFYSKPRH